MEYQITGEPTPGGYIERVELDLIEELPAGEVTVFDVGANVGDFTQAVLERRPEARVFAFDPLPECQEALRRRFGSRVTVCGGLGARAEMLEFFSDAPASQLGTLYPRPWIPEIQTRSVGHLPVGTISQVCRDHGIQRIDLLKLDCEGHEYQVLVGASDALNAIQCLYWEMSSGEHRYRNGVEIVDFKDLLHGFDIWNMCPEGPSGPEGASGLTLYAARKEDA